MNPNRMQASSAEVGNEAKGGDSDAKNEMQGAQARLIVSRIKGAAIVLVAVEIFPVDGVGEVTHHVVAGSKCIFARRKLRKGRKTELRIFVKVREITQFIP